MRKLTLLAILTVIALVGFSQTPANINRMEFYFDIDPGYGQATPVSITPGNNIDVAFNADISSLADGFHNIFFRARDANGLWSSVHYRSFLKEKLITNKKINLLEYFINNDPGYGNGTKLSFTPANVIDRTFVAPISSLQDGFHTIFFRAKDESNQWSTLISRSFLKEKFFPAKNIVSLEYFINTDPGLGKATPVSIIPGNEFDKSFIVPIGSLPNGFHTIYFRAKDENHNWSTVMLRNFLKEQYIPDKIITHMEYFIDIDPGFGNGVSVPITDSTYVEKDIIVDLKDIDDGFHTIFFRVRDINKKWSTVYMRNFLKEAEVTLDMKKIDMIEYFVDNDPGFGKGTKIPIPEEEQTNILIKDFIAELPDLGSTNHRFFVRCRDKMGNWSHVYDTVYCQGPSSAFNTTPVCMGETTHLNYTEAGVGPNTSFFWDVNNDGIIESTDKGSITWEYTVAGTYYAKLLVVDNSICPNNYRDSTIVQVIVHPLPDVSISPSGTTKICPGTYAALNAVSENQGLSYQWYKDGIPVSLGYSSTYSPSQEGNYKVVVTSPAGCKATSNTVTIELYPQPSASIEPSGNINICDATEVTFTANSGENLSWQWMKNSAEIIGATSTSFTLTGASASDNGYYNVIVKNSFGCTTQSGFALLGVHPYPDVYLGKDTVIDTRQTVLLNAGGGYAQYLWNDDSEEQTLLLSGNSLGLGTYTYSVTVTTVYGCKGADTVVVTVVKPVPVIAGIVQYENPTRTPIDSVKVYLLDAELTAIDSVFTTTTGKYSFKNMPAGDYILLAKGTKKWRGANPTDALLINRHFVQLAILPSALKIKSADVNIDNKYNSLDALTVNRRYVKLISSFKAGDWLFESPQLNFNGIDDVNRNILGLCFGDVNASDF